MFPFFLIAFTVRMSKCYVLQHLKLLFSFFQQLMHAIVMVHKMQRMALSTNQLLPVKPDPLAVKPDPLAAAKPVLPNSAPAKADAEGDFPCWSTYIYI